jgi:formylglycine-generating enzyme required for sulfatase activity
MVEGMPRWLLFPSAALALGFLGCRAAPRLAAEPRAGEAWRSDALDMSFRYVPPGPFRMGSTAEEAGRDDDETPHRVTLTRGLWLGETEVTQAQWSRLAGTRPSLLGACGPDCPVESVSWYDAVTFANRASEAEGLPACYELAGCEGSMGTGCPDGEDWCDGSFRCARVLFAGLDCRGYRLPTEAEWERAARAGTGTAAFAGSFEVVGLNSAPALSPIAWYGGNSGVAYRPAWPCGDWTEKELPAVRCGIHSVGGRRANPWGLHDVLGNVSEWTHDWYAAQGPEPSTDPLGPATGDDKVRKGCTWSSIPRHCRAADRTNEGPTLRDRTWGLRLARTAP